MLGNARGLLVTAGDREDGPGTDDVIDSSGRRSTIHRVGIGGGSPEGENAAYVLPERGVVVDPGPPGDGNWERLRDGIRASGLAVRDVRHVVVTHWHADHAGLAPRLRERADATVWMGADDAPLLRAYDVERDRRLERDATRLREWGVPDPIRAEIESADTPSPFPSELPVRSLADGDSVGDTDVRALHVPGHTAGHVALSVPDRTADGRSPGTLSLLLGDVVLPTYTPNVGGGDTRMERPLASYLRSLDRLESIAADPDRSVRAHPGHGSKFDLTERIGAIRDHHTSRSRKMVRAVDRLTEDSFPDAATPWAVAEARFGELRGIHAKMGAGEAASHLEALEAEGALERVGDAPIRYGPVTE